MSELRPFSYMDWVQALDASIVSESDLFGRYNSYLANWYKDKKLEAEGFDEYRRDVYVDLLREVTINYTTEDEKRYLSNINYNSRRELDAILPFFVTRLKEITQYIVNIRNEVSTVRAKQNLKGSERGVKAAVTEIVTDLLDDPDFTDKHPIANMYPLSSIVDNIYIELEPLYDNYEHYFDTSATVLSSTYVSPGDPLLSKNYLNNTEDIDIDVWTNMDKAIKELLAELPILLELNDDKEVCTFGMSSKQNLIGLNIPRTDITQLPLNYFITESKTSDNLLITFKKKLIEKFGGTKMYYLSTGTTATEFVSGVLYDPQNQAANYLNRYTAGHATVPSRSHIDTLKDIGGFFTPQLEGVLNYERITSIYKLNVNRIEPNTVYAFPDPELYGTGRGNSLTDSSNIIVHTDDNSPIKGNRANQTLYGDISNDQFVQKFYPYQSKEETLQLQALGISRSYDDVDFWSGEEKDIWAKDDIYPKKPLQPYPISEKQSDLLIRDDAIYEWKTDIYGNEFALYKTTHPIRLTSEQKSGNLIGSAIQETGDTSVLSVTGAFDYPETKSFRYQYSNQVTQYENKTTPLTSADTVYNRRVGSTPNLFFRNVYSTDISPASSSLSAVFIKYIPNADIINEINNEIVSFDIIDNVIILHTTNFLILEKYEYSLTTNTFESILPVKVFISVSGMDSNFNKICNHWYDEYTDRIYMTKTVLHPFLSGSNYKCIYPNIYTFDMNKHTFNEVYSLRTLLPGTSSLAKLNDAQETYNLLLTAGYVIGTPYTPVAVASSENVNVTYIDMPSVTLNSLDNMLSINFFGNDPAGTPILFNWYYDAADRVQIKTKQLDVFLTNKHIFNHNICNYKSPNITDGLGTLSGIIEGAFQRGGNESRVINMDAFRSQYFLQDDQVYYPIAFGSSVSGMDTNPAGYKDYETCTIRLAAGLSGSQSGVDGRGSVEDTTQFAVTGVHPYTHSAGHIVHSAALTGIGTDIVVTFDFALYTNTTQNSAYAQVVEAVD